MKRHFESVRGDTLTCLLSARPRRALLALQFEISAAVVLRAQYEATLRAIWVCYAAKDEEVLLLSGDLRAKAFREKVDPVVAQ